MSQDIQSRFLNEGNKIFLQPWKFCLNLFQTFWNMNILSWIYFFTGHPVEITVDKTSCNRLFLLTRRLSNALHKRLFVSLKYFCPLEVISKSKEDHFWIETRSNNCNFMTKELRKAIMIRSKLRNNFSKARNEKFKKAF